MADDLFQLIFLALVLVGWLIRAAAERRQRRETARRPKDMEQAPPVERPTTPLPVPFPPEAPTATDTIAEHAEAVGFGGLQDLDSASWAGTSDRHETTAAADLKASHVAALRRLAGGTTARPGPAMVRAGMLWSEVLGPCRAIRGPHRPPSAARRRT